jgi:hypothetical protein
MKKIYLIFIVTILFLSSCAPSPEAIQKAIEQTQTAMPTAINTKIPTSTFTQPPTLTPKATMTETIDQINQQLKSVLIDGISSLDGVQKVNSIVFGNGEFQIEVVTNWSSQDHQPQVSYEIMQYLSILCNHFKQDYFSFIVGNKSPIFSITTYSAMNEYRYKSSTQYDTCVKIGNKDISYEEWIIDSNAGFR